jgi:cytochrome d ubiquinol oxidase subunit II
MLIALMLRGVAFEFRAKATGWHQQLWNRLFFAGSLGASVAQGMMLGGVVTGFREGWAFVAFELLVGLGLAGAYALLGATWLVIKTEGDLQARALRWGRVAVFLAAGGVAAISLATPFASANIMEKWFVWPRLLWLSPLPVLTAAAFAGILVSLHRLRSGKSRREYLPFVLAVWVFVFAFAGLAYSLFPYLVVDRMTIWQAAAAQSSLRFVFIGACIVLPMIVAYTLFSYRVFWGKARSLTYGE